MPRRISICLVTANYWPAWGGAERQCQLLARVLSQRGHEVVILTRSRRDRPANDHVDGLAVRRTPAFGPGLLGSAVWTLTAAAWLHRQARRFHIVHAYQLLSPSHVGILGRRRSGPQATVLRPACSGPYGDIAEVRRLPLTGLRRQLLRRADAFVTLTEEIEAELTGFGLASIPFHRIPNGVDAAAFTPAPTGERAGLRTRLGLPTDRALCAFIGRLVPQKRPELLLEAWAHRATSRAHLVFVGDGPLRSALEAQTDGAPLAGRVSFLGAVADMAALVRAVDLVVLPSSAEGISNAMLEAMACGVPVIATDVGGNRAVLGGGARVGWLVPVDDPGALVEAIKTLAESPALRHEIGAAARARVLEQYDIQRVATQHLSLYAGLLS